MKMIAACEFSGVVREAFAARGHDAWSCDLLETEIPSKKHIILKDDAGLKELLYGEDWDLVIGFPPCTFIASSGLHWNRRIPGRRDKTEAALTFVCMILNCPAKKLGLENPVGCIGTRIASINGVYTVLPLESADKVQRIKATQTVHPWQFGHDASKATCLYLRGLPALVSTKMVAPGVLKVPYHKALVKRWGNQTPSGNDKCAPSPDRWKVRSRTYPGIAKAMAEQWG